jgi:uncharacterized protein involved in exopolysaccharide biosynthesis
MTDGSAIKFSYLNTDQRKAQATLSALIAGFAEALGRDKIQPGMNLEVLDPPSLPNTPANPNRLRVLVMGTCAGLLLGLLVGGTVKHPKRAVVFASFGIAGLLVGGASSFLIKDEYVSKAVMRISHYDPAFEQSLTRIAGSDVSVHVLRPIGPPGKPGLVMEVMARDSDPRGAQTRVSIGINKLMAASRPNHFEMLDSPEVPKSPIFPNRAMISFVGLLVGMILATATLLIQSRKPRHV